MRSPEQIFEEIEEDRASREREMRLVENVILRSQNEDEQVMLRRSLVLLTYAHLEGFCKFALSSYASSVNALQIACKDASIPLVALTLSKVFAALRDPNSKHKELSKLIDDRDLHLAARERRFIENFEQISATKVEIPDHAVDTKSNLSSIVLKRNLYKLGLPYPIVDKMGSSIDRLLGVRNAIAHGDKLKKPKESDVAEYLSATFDVMKFVQQEIFTALSNKAYQRNSGLDLPPPAAQLGLLERTMQYMRSFGN